MILVRRDAAIIPKKVFDVAARAQAKLESLPADKRADFIKKKSHIWRAFGRYLAKMSYGKCWYSECKDCHSFYDVDHFRPKLEAKQAEHEEPVPGYDWLAFEWENYRYSATCSNRLSKNEDTGETDGKGTWFPLLDGSMRATWESRSQSNEKPVLLDPLIKDDVALLDALDDGRVGAAKFVVGTARYRVTRSCQLYGLNLPSIKAARQKVMRDVEQLLNTLIETVVAINEAGMPYSAEDRFPLEQQKAFIGQMTSPQSEFSRAACLVLRNAGCPELCGYSSNLPESFGS